MLGGTEFCPLAFPIPGRLRGDPETPEHGPEDCGCADRDGEGWVPRSCVWDDTGAKRSGRRPKEGDLTDGKTGLVQVDSTEEEILPKEPSPFSPPGRKTTVSGFSNGIRGRDGGVRAGRYRDRNPLDPRTRTGVPVGVGTRSPSDDPTPAPPFSSPVLTP